MPCSLVGRSSDASSIWRSRFAGASMLIGEEIPTTYSAEDVLLMPGLFKGSFVFLADLVHRTYWPLWVDFLVASSYGTTVPGRPLAVTCASSIASL